MLDAGNPADAGPVAVSAEEAVTLRGRVIAPAGVRLKPSYKLRANIEEVATDEISDETLDEHGSFEVTLFPGVTYWLRFEQVCDQPFEYRVPESSREFSRGRWSGYYSADEDDERKPGDLMMELACPWHEEKVQLPAAAPLVVNWKSDLVPVLVELVNQRGVRVDETVAYENKDERGTVVGAGYTDADRGDDAAEGSDKTQLSQLRLLLPPGRYQLSGTMTPTAFDERTGRSDPELHGSLKMVVPQTDHLVRLRMVLKR